MATPIDVVFKCRKICSTKSVKKQNFCSFSNCRCCADRAQNLPGPAPNMWLIMLKFHANRFTVGDRVIAERVKAVLLAHRIFPWFARMHSGRIINSLTALYDVINSDALKLEVERLRRLIQLSAPDSESEQSNMELDFDRCNALILLQWIV